MMDQQQVQPKWQHSAAAVTMVDNLHHPEIIYWLFSSQMVVSLRVDLEQLTPRFLQV